MTTGILVVSLTSPNGQGRSCKSAFQRMVIDFIGQNSRPFSVDIGDFNNDNNLDIAVANKGTDTIDVFLGDGDGSFIVQKPYSTGDKSSPISIAVGDFNQDKHLDLAVANYGTNSIGIHFGYGNGTFAAQVLVTLGASRPLSIAVGHFNNDSRLDIVVANYATNNIALLLAYDNETFVIYALYSMGYDSLPSSIAVADLNNDHNLDIVVTNYGTDNIGILFGYGNGTFANQILYTTGIGSQPNSIAIGDFNNDTSVDIVVVNSNTNAVVVFLGYGNGSFTIRETLVTGVDSQPTSIAVGDFNGDNILDISVSNFGTDTVDVFTGYGNGTFTNMIAYAITSGSNPCSIAAGNFNKDTRSDITVANYGTNNVLILLDFDPTNFQNQTTYSTGFNSSPYAIAVGDFNNDNNLDVVVANRYADNVGVRLGHGNGSFSAQVTYSTGSGSGPCSIVTGDFNNDNQLDIAIANYDAFNIGVLFGYGNGTFANQITYTTESGSGPWSITAGDLNNDHLLDIIVANRVANNIGVFLARGNGIFENQVTYLIASFAYPTSVAVGDLDNDNVLDIIVANFVLGNIAVFFGYGNGTFSNPEMYINDPGSYYSSVAVGHFNSDKWLDIITVNFLYTTTVIVLLGTGNRTFSEETTILKNYGTNPTSIAIGDLNNDHREDAIISDPATNTVNILLGLGDGTFGYQTYYSTGIDSNPQSVTVGDIDHDTLLDILVADSNTNNIGIFLAYNLGRIIDQNSYTTGAGVGPYAVAIGDFNDDQHLDIAIANYFTENVGVLLGDGNGTFIVGETSSTEFGSRPFSIAVGDINNDKRVDIIVSNSGINSIGVLYGYGNGSFSNQTMFSSGTNSNPHDLVVDDLNGDNLADIIVANYGTDNVGVLLGHHFSTFTTQTAYSAGPVMETDAIGIADFNNDKQLDIAVVNYADNSIGILFGYSNGSFSNQSILSTGSDSSPYSLAIGDFNNDNSSDIVVTNYGMNNIGVWLGFGNGTFSNQITFPTGSDSMPQSVAVGDFNNDHLLDIVVFNSAMYNIGVFLGYGNGSFANQITFDTGRGNLLDQLVVADLNNDGQLDIVAPFYMGNWIGVILGYGNGTFRWPQMYSTGVYSYPISVAIGDFNNDTWLDIAVACLANYIDVFYGIGNGSFSSPISFSTGTTSGPYSIAVGDLNNDKFLDMVVANYDGQNIGVFFGYGDGNFSNQELFPIKSNSYPSVVAIGDFNKDKLLDVVVASSINDTIYVLFGNDTISFWKLMTFSTGNGSRPWSIAVSDFNNDSHRDIAVVNFDTNNVCILIGYGNGTFTNQTILSTGLNSHPLSIALGDFNRDNQLDIVVANNATNNIGIFLGYGNGSFENQINYLIDSGSNPYSVAVSDLSNDNRLDIIVTNYGADSVTILYGHDNGTFGNRTDYQLSYESRPCSLAIGDLDNGNRLDIVISSFGLNNIDILLRVC